MTQIKIEVPEKLIPLITKPKPLKIAVGGRGAGKTIAFSDCFLKYCYDGEKIICAREFQNSIEESVHSSLIRRIQLHDVPGLHPTKSSLESESGGKVVYLGLARNLGSVKSFDGANRVWIEEGQYVSQDSIDLLFPTIREAGSEIWVSMNRGSSKDPISKSFLNKAEKELSRCGYYEDDFMIVVEINYNDNPWFPDKLEMQRQHDFETMDRAKYDHIWLGKYSDTVENAIIRADWFDACIDAHKKLGFEPSGIEVVSHDPSDLGDDDKALCYRHGVVIEDVRLKKDGDINDGADWALDYAIQVKADAFVWDADGMGAGIKRQIKTALEGKRMLPVSFSGALAVDNPDQSYEPIDGEFYGSKVKSNKQTFLNRRAQRYWELRDRIYTTWEAINKKKYHDPSDMISFSSKIDCLDTLRSEICRIPRKDNGLGKIQILNKVEMKKLDIDSPNAADSVMMSFDIKSVRHHSRRQKLNYPKLQIA